MNADCFYEPVYKKIKNKPVNLAHFDGKTGLVINCVTRLSSIQTADYSLEAWVDMLIYVNDHIGKCYYVWHCSCSEIRILIAVPTKYAVTVSELITSFEMKQKSILICLVLSLVVWPNTRPARLSVCARHLLFFLPNAFYFLQSTAFDIASKQVKEMSRGNAQQQKENADKLFHLCTQKQEHYFFRKVTIIS